jgi:hypothetical protein
MENMMRLLHPPPTYSQPMLDVGQRCFATELANLSGFHDLQGSGSPTLAPWSGSPFNQLNEHFQLIPDQR